MSRRAGSTSGMRPSGVWLRGGLFAALLLGGWSCGSSTVPVWGPEAPASEEDGETADAPITDVDALAQALKADPMLRVAPTPTEEGTPPGVDPGRLVELPAEGPAADPEVLHKWLVDLGVTKVQLEGLLPSDPAPDVRAADAEPGVLRLRLRRAPKKTQ